ncbi:hypothetical protein BJX63DRAFT_438692 [Aspergillus granulosus]|uniref:Major facilitator superfamily (MFS) profile domain-containing protein n=1 Tax=Aspergillus granulosus TaxID=176169 RepID=A0ABR4GRR5_9EURO
MAGTMLGTGAATTTGTAGNYPDTAAQASVALLILWYCIYGPAARANTLPRVDGKFRIYRFCGGQSSARTKQGYCILIDVLGVQADLGGGVTFIYGAFSVVAAVWIWIFVPETKDLSLEELNDMFQAKVKAKEFKSYMCTGLGAEITNLDGGDMKKEKTELEWVEGEQRVAQLSAWRYICTEVERAVY